MIMKPVRSSAMQTSSTTVHLTRGQFQIVPMISRPPKRAGHAVLLQNDDLCVTSQPARFLRSIRVCSCLCQGYAEVP